jgi:peptidyl-prolyl cis-trans isomerase B (cyclophilin B)
MLRKLVFGNLYGGIVASKRNKHEEHAAKARLQMFEAKQELEVIKQVRRSRDNRFALIASAATLVLVVALQSVYFSVGPGHSTPKASNPQASASSSSSIVPSSSIAEGKSWDVTLTINGSPLAITLDGAKAPQSTANFLALANKGFFNNTTCHRLTTKDVYILQCGDPTASGTGGPGYSYGPIENAPKVQTATVNGKKITAALYKAGTIAMARQSNKADSQGSQFFIVYKDSYFPNDAAGGYTVFGQIKAGLQQLDPDFAAGVQGGGSDGKPVRTFKINVVALLQVPTALKNNGSTPSSSGAK